jgi:hypothetical protein
MVKRRPTTELARLRPPPARGRVVAPAASSGRRFAIYRGSELMGTTHLEYPVVAWQRAAGEFFPTRHYYLVERVFLRLADTITHGLPSLPDRLHERDALGLELWLSGERLDAVVELISQWEPRRWMVHVATRDARFWSGPPPGAA